MMRAWGCLVALLVCAGVWAQERPVRPLDVPMSFAGTSDVERFAEKSPVKDVGTVPADTHKAITYPGAV